MEAVLAMLLELLGNPIVQSSALPLVAGLACAALLYPLRLEGLAAIAGFLAAVFAIGNFGFEPLTATRKIVLTGAAAAVIGALSDFAFKPTRTLVARVLLTRGHAVSATLAIFCNSTFQK